MGAQNTKEHHQTIQTAPTGSSSKYPGGHNVMRAGAGALAHPMGGGHHLNALNISSPLPSGFMFATFEEQQQAQLQQQILQHQQGNIPRSHNSKASKYNFQPPGGGAGGDGNLHRSNAYPFNSSGEGNYIFFTALVYKLFES